MMYDRYQIERIKDHNPIVEIVGADIALTKRGKIYKSLCPFHQEKTPSFEVNPEKKFYHCFGCGAHGDQIKWLIDYRYMTFQEALTHLVQRAGIAP